jgi:hypothetical protein
VLLTGAILRGYWGSEVPEPTDQFSGELVRSVGVADTSLFSTGTVTISSNIATFTNAFPTTVGVGDMIEYTESATIYLACIKGISLDRRKAYVKEPDDTDAIATTGETFDIFRAYDSLFLWEGDADDSDENADIHIDVRDFDTSLDLTTLTKIMNVALYKEGVIPGYTQIAGWTTSSSYYINIFTPFSAEMVGTSQRHTGTKGTGAILQVQTNDKYMVTISDTYVYITGVEFDANNIGTTSNRGGISVYENSLYVSKCLFYNQDARPAFSVETTAVDGTSYFFNNIVIDGTYTAATPCVRNNDSGSTIIAYNNTLINTNGNGILVSNGTIVAKSNICENTGGTDCYSGSFHADSDHNISSDLTKPGGGNDQTEVTLTFSGGDDYHLDVTDTEAIEQGEDLYPDSDGNLNITDDIDNGARDSGTPDVGADEYDSP